MFGLEADEELIVKHEGDNFRVCAVRRDIPSHFIAKVLQLYPGTISDEEVAKFLYADDRTKNGQWTPVIAKGEKKQYDAFCEWFRSKEIISKVYPQWHALYKEHLDVIGAILESNPAINNRLNKAIVSAFHEVYPNLETASARNFLILTYYFAYAYYGGLSDEEIRSRFPKKWQDWNVALIFQKVKSELRSKVSSENSSIPFEEIKMRLKNERPYRQEQS